MECVASTLHTTSEHGVSSITTADPPTSTASSRLNWRPCRFKWTRPFRRRTKSGFCACATIFQTQSTRRHFVSLLLARLHHINCVDPLPLATVRYETRRHMERSEFVSPPDTETPQIEHQLTTASVSCLAAFVSSNRFDCITHKSGQYCTGKTLRLLCEDQPCVSEVMTVYWTLLTYLLNYLIA